jgi:N-acetylglucosaminyl-diphospho-decaprenol L-rhamnosyltransferase
MKTVDLAILNYNGRKHLEYLLPTAVAEAGHYSGPCRVVVVDNGSAADELAWIEKEFPTVVIWRAPRNDFLFSYNAFAKDSAADIVVLLNNDLKLCSDFIEPLVKHLSWNDVFSVGATSRDWDDRKFTCGPARLAFAHGFYSWAYDCSSQRLQHTLFTSGGFMAVDRSKFLQLGGFSRLYHPAYCEDLDVCFRAWRRGWRCIFEPASVALHRETGSWDEAGAAGLNRMSLRNSLLFQWSSLPMKRGRFARWWSICKVAMGNLLRGDAGWLKTIFITRLYWLRQRRTLPADPLTEAELKQVQDRIGQRLDKPSDVYEN